jgi:hypothetical protein
VKQKLTRIIATPENAVSPIKTKRERLFHVYSANSKKAWRSRKRVAAARAASEAKQEREEAA